MRRGAEGYNSNLVPMIAVADAQARILAQIGRPTSPEVLPLAQALGRTLAHDVEAPFDVPPADNSAVDGYAVAAADLVADGRARLHVVCDLPAGLVHEGTLAPGETVRIMTGAPMPAGADTVVPRELAEVVGDTVLLSGVPPGANVRARGEDVRAGAVVLQRGRALRPQELGLLASLGFPDVWVHARPRVAMLSTGDEVVEPGLPRKPGQIYDANRFSLAALVVSVGARPIDLGIVPDLRDLLRT